MNRIQSIVICLLTTLALSGAAVANEELGHQEVFITVITSGQVPDSPVAPAQGHGVGFLTLDRRTSVLCWSVSYDAIPDEFEAAFHGPSAPGEATEEHMWPEEGMSLALGSPKNGCSDPLSQEQVNFLRKGLWYINLHTLIAPEGEYRGQILPVAGVQYNGHYARDEEGHH